MDFKNFKDKKISKEKTKCTICEEGNSISVVGDGYDYEFKTNKVKWTNYYCKKCSHYFLNPRPKIKEALKIYPKNYYPALNYKNISSKIILYMRYFFERKRYIKLTKNFSEYSCIVDIGAGDGRILGYLRYILGEKARLIAIDIAVDNKTKKYFDEINVQYIESSIEDLNLINIKNKADIILMNQVLEHLWFPKKVFSKLKYILNKNGLTFIETPNPNCFSRKWQGNRYWGGWHRPRHRNLFTRKSFSLFLNKNNFSLVNYSEFSVPAFWIMGIRNYHNISTHENNTLIGKLFSLQNIVSLIIFTILEYIILIFNFGASNHRFIVKKGSDE